MLTYQELVALGEQESVDPVLANKLNTLLTTPYINNEAYFAGTKPIRPDLKGLGPSLRLVEWNIERGVELCQPHGNKVLDGTEEFIFSSEAPCRIALISAFTREIARFCTSSVNKFQE